MIVLQGYDAQLLILQGYGAATGNNIPGCVHTTDSAAFDVEISTQLVTDLTLSDQVFTTCEAESEVC